VLSISLNLKGSKEMSISHELYKVKTQVKCPKCGGMREISKGAIYRWTTKNIGKTFDDYALETYCKSCANFKKKPERVRGLRIRDIYTVKCSKCGETRQIKGITIQTWLTERQDKNTEDYFKENLCRSCVGVKDGLRINYQGYSVVLLKANDKFASMCPHHKGVGTLLCLENRYLMAKMLDRPLEKWEVVHHKDGNKLNNPPDCSNYELVTRQSHLTVGFTNEKENYYIGLIIRLRKEIEELKSKLPLDKG
jgi:ssDNA-binding Zn-finger/Zn-ribbon topoisomerase 1